MKSLILTLLFVGSAQAAIVEKQFQTWGNEPNQVIALYRYDDTTDKITELGVDNRANSGFPACVQQRRGGGNGAAIAGFFPSGELSFISVPQNGANSIQIIWNSKGKPDNLDGQFQYPFVYTDASGNLVPHTKLNPNPLTPCANFKE